jgi:hypothetical protein
MLTLQRLFGGTPFYAKFVPDKYEAMKILKCITIAILLSGISPAIKAQVDTVSNPEQFIFPEFYVGVVKTLNGEKVVLNLNYNIVTEKMVFMQNNQIFDITSQSIIDTVFIEGRKFVPRGKLFYELLANGKATFFVQHKGSVKIPSKQVGYGGTSDVASTSYVSNMRLGNDRFRMEKATEIIIEPGSLYWIRKNDDLNLVNGKSSLLQIFSDKKTEVKKFMGRSKFDAENPDHINNLVEYYNGLF